MQEEIEKFLIRANIIGNNKSMPTTVEGSYSRHGHDPVRCTVLPDNPTLGPDYWIKVDHHPYDCIELEGAYGGDIQIWIPRLKIESSLCRGDTLYLEGAAELFVTGLLDEYEDTDGIIDVFLYTPRSRLLPTHMIGYEPDLVDGTIKATDQLDQRAICWTTSSGNDIEFCNEYAFRSRTGDFENILLRIQRCGLKISVDPTSYNSLKAVASDIWVKFDEALWLLSFLGKQYIPWYRASITLEGDPRFRWAEVRREVYLPDWSEINVQKGAQFELLVKPDVLKDGVFAEMFSAYENSPNRKLILSLIQTLLASYEAYNVENKLSLTYVALEMLVSGLSDDKDTYIIGEARFKEFEKQFKKFIKNETGFGKDIRSAIYDKLRELQRYSFHTRLGNMLIRHGLDIAKFWPPDFPTEKAGRQMIKRRNEYIHKGIVGDDSELIADITRLRLIVEIVILKILGYPLKEINRRNWDVHVAVGGNLPDGYDFGLSERA